MTLDQQQARDLLHRAADTIDVEPEPVEVAHERRPSGWWRPVVAAAAVLAIVGIGLGATQLVRGGSSSSDVRSLIGKQPGDHSSRPTPSRRDVAEQFVAWARDPGAEPPPFADRVRVLAADDEVRTLTGGAVDDPAGYDLCPDGARCPSTASALTVLDEYFGRFAYSTVPARTCADRVRTLADVLKAKSGRVIRIGPPRPSTCAGTFAVELTFDHDDRITGVNTFVQGG